MKRETRLAWLHRLVNKEAKELTSKTPITGDYYEDGKLKRFSVLMINKDVITVNEHGNVCHVFLSASNTSKILGDIFSADEELGGNYEVRIDKRLGNFRDYIKKKELRKKRREEKNEEKEKTG